MRRAADLRTIAFLVLLAGSFVAACASRAVALVPVLGLLVFIANCVKHNHMHCPTFHSRAANVAMNVALTVLTGTSCTGIIVPHNQRHHSSPQSDGDFVRASLVRFHSNAANLFLFPWASMIDMARNKPSELVAWRGRRLWWLVVLERVSAIGTFVAVALFDWRVAVVIVGAPWLIGQLILLAINLLQHQHLTPADARTSSRDVTGFLLNALTFNAGYHSAHHLEPAAHWSDLPALHAARIAGADRAALEFPSLTSLVVERLRADGA